MPVLITCKIVDDPIKTGANVSTTLSPLYVYGENFRRSRARNFKANSPIWPEIGLIRDFMPVLVNCKFDEEKRYPVHNIVSGAQAK